MLKPQIDQYDMLLAVENHFDDNTTLWTSNAPITAAKTLLSAKIDEIAVEIGTQLRNTTGIAVDKAVLRDDLEHKGFILSAGLSAYAATTPSKNDLYNRSHFTKTDFDRLTDNDLTVAITDLHRDATTELANLATYGVTAAMLTAITTTNSAFAAIMKNPTEAIGKRKAATDKIAVLLPQAITLLETRMDNLMVVFGTTQPQFAAVYNNVRTINNSPTTQLSLTVTTLDAKTNEPVANANLEIIGEGVSRITRVSSERGYNTVKNLTIGHHNLTVNHPKFATQTIPFTVVNNETTELVITLERVMETVR